MLRTTHRSSSERPSPITTPGRAIGLGALVLAIAYILLTVGRPLLLLAFGQADDGDFLRPAVAVSVPSQIVGVLVAVVFFVISACMLVMRTGLERVSAAGSVWGSVVLGGALIGATGFAFAGASGRVILSAFAGALAQTGADGATQVAALHMGNVFAGAAAVTSGLGLAVLLLGIATIGARGGVVGAPTAIFAAAVAVVLVVGFVVFAFLPVQLLAPMAFLVVGIVALRRSRTRQEATP